MLNFKKHSCSKIKGKITSKEAMPETNQLCCGQRELEEQQGFITTDPDQLKGKR